MEAHDQITATKRNKPKVLRYKSRQVGTGRKVPKYGRGGMFSRFLSGTKTGTTPHFKLWMADLNLKRALQNTSLASIADRHKDPKMATAYGMLVRHGFKTVWDLTQAKRGEIWDVPQFGPKRVAAVKADLAKNQVAVNW